jgi:hypothetical protein
MPVVDDVGSQVLPSIAVRNGIVYMAMMNKKNWDIDFTEGFPVNGVYRFDKPYRVNDDPSGNWHYAPSLAVDDENDVCIAWVDARNGDYDIYFLHGIKDGGVWQFSENFKVNDNSENVSHYTPSLVFENGNIYIAWYDNRNKDFDIYFSEGRFINKNWEFDKNVKVNDDVENSDQMHPEIAVKDGEIYIVWEDGRDGGSDIYFSKYVKNNDSLEFVRNTKVNDIKGKHYDPQIAVDGRDVYVVWQGEINDSGDIYFSEGRLNGKNWEFSRNIKINDDLTDSFTKPDTVFLGLIIGPILVLIFLVFLRKYGKRKN